uniref:HAT C-terminal dimerisation domain-containing protein n=1 Tax=Triticum urartu TaxID=4572 RepID=A0A8R7V8E2_TRIUA
MKKKGVSIVALWERASKANKRTSTSTPNPPDVEVESIMLVETNKHEQYHIVYKLLKLVLILPVATASVERVFSSMSYVKNKLRNKMGDEYLNN